MMEYLQVRRWEKKKQNQFLLSNAFSVYTIWDYWDFVQFKTFCEYLVILPQKNYVWRFDMILLSGFYKKFVPKYVLENV